MSSVGVERVEQLRRRASRARVADLGVLPTFSVGQYVWAKFGRTRGILLARVLSPHPAAMPTIDYVRDWWEVEVFAISLGIWNRRPSFRRVLRTLTDEEIGDLRSVGVIE